MADALAANIKLAVAKVLRQASGNPQWLVLGVAAILWLAGQWLGIWLLFLPCALLLALALLAYVWPRYQLRWVRLNRRLPQALRAQQPGFIEYDLTSRWPVWQLSIRQALPCGNLQESHKLELDFLRAPQTLALAVTPEDCGRFELPDVELVSGFPFNLWPARRCLRVSSNELWVHPHLVNWLDSPSTLGSHEGAVSRAHSPATSGASHFIALRDYVWSDGPQLIDWKTSAKYQQWRVKCFATEEHPRVLMAIDTRASFNHGLGGRSTRAVQLSLATSLARHFCGNGREVWIVTEQGNMKLPAGNHHFGGLDDFLTALATTGERAGWELLAEYPHSGAQLLVHWVLDEELGDLQSLQIAPGATQWNMIMEAANFSQPMLLSKNLSKRRDHQTWNFHLSANTQWELLFREIAMEAARGDY